MSIRPMTVRVRSVPPCVSSQIGSRHLPLKQGIVSSSLTWRTNFHSGCGVTLASESWELVATVRFYPPRPWRIVGPDGLRHGVANAETPVRIRYDAPNLFAPVAQMEERDASNVEVAGPSPARSSKSFAIFDCRLRIGLSLQVLFLFSRDEVQRKPRQLGNRQLAIGNAFAEVM